MDVFWVHEQVIADYRAFTTGFVEVRRRRIKTYVGAVRRGRSVARAVGEPEPVVRQRRRQSTISFADGLLHPECDRIFRRKGDLHDAGSRPIVLHRHQREAVEVARTGNTYVLTTGTGSGKSLAYIVPIVDAVLRERDETADSGNPA